MTEIPIVIVAFGTIPKGLVKRMEDLVTRLSIPIRGRGKITWRRPEVKFGRNVVKEETTQKLPNKRTSEDHPNYTIVKIGQNTEKSPGDLRRLAVAQTPVKTH